MTKGLGNVTSKCSRRSPGGVSKAVLLLFLIPSRSASASYTDSMTRELTSVGNNNIQSSSDLLYFSGGGGVASLIGGHELQQMHFAGELFL